MSREPNRNVYVGHRYVPLILGEWDKSIRYEGLSVVIYKGNSYTSKKYVPVGIDIHNEEFWVITGNYNVQVENYRQEVYSFDGRITDNNTNITDIKSDISSHDNRITTNKNDITNHENRVSDNESDITDIKSDINSHDNRITTNKNNITNHENRISDNESDIIKNAKDISERISKGEHFISVIDFGAKGDGVTDDTQSFKNAIEVVEQENKPLYIPNTGNRYNVNEYIQSSHENIEVISNNAEIYGKGFWFTDTEKLKISGLKFTPRNKTLSDNDDSIRAYKVREVNIQGNVFNGGFVRLRSDDVNFENDYVNVSNNLFTGDSGNSGEATYGNLVEVYGHENINIKDNVFKTLNAHRMIKLSSALGLGGTITKEGINNVVNITGNSFMGSLRNGKQIIDTFIGTDNLNIQNNYFGTLNTTLILDTKIASGGSTSVSRVLHNINVSNNIVEILDDVMIDLFRVFSHSNTEIDNGSITSSIFNNNIINIKVDKPLTSLTVRGIKKVNANNNILNSMSKTGIYNAIVCVACEDINISNNNIESGSIRLTSRAGSSNPDLNYEGSAKNIIINGNNINDIRTYGGVYINDNNSIENLVIEGNNFKFNREREDYILGVLYIRDNNIETSVITGNSVVSDYEPYERSLFINTVYNRLTENNNSWNPSISYSTAPPTTGTYRRGDIIYYTNVSTNRGIGAICTEGGSPGTWFDFGKIEVPEV